MGNTFAHSANTPSAVAPVAHGVQAESGPKLLGTLD